MDIQSRTAFGSPPRSAQEAQEALDSLVMTWAHDIETGQPVYIMELGPERNGGKCGCECRSCGYPLKAANVGKEEGTYIQKPHFKHRIGVVKDSCLVLVARAAALRLLVEDGMIDLPPRTRSTSWQGLSGAEYQGTAEIHAKRRRVASCQFKDRTSAVLTLDDGKQLLVQLTGTNIQSEPSSGEAAEGRATIFIDINDPRLAGMSPDELRTRLRLLPEAMCWHTHWEDANLEQEAAAAAMLRAQEMLDWPDGISAQNLEAVPPELRRVTVLHLTVKQILAASGQLRVPILAIQEVAGSGGTRATVDAVIVKQQSLVLSNPRLEHRLGKIIPDVCADAMDAEGNNIGLLCIEVTVTNGFDPARLARVSRANRLTLEIDLSEAYGRISRSELAKLVIDGLAGKRWLHHPDRMRRQEEQRAAAMTASEAKARDLEEASRAEREAAASRPSREPGSERSAAIGLALNLPSPDEDRVRCRIKVKSLQSGWAPSEDLLDGLLSLRHGTGVGQHRGLTAGQVAHKLRCTIDTNLHCLILIALNAFGAAPGEADRSVVDEWAATTREKIRAKEPMWLPPTGALPLIKELLPELSAAVDKMIEFIRSKPKLESRWTSGEPPVGRLRRAEAMRHGLFNDGAFRLYAPRVDYDRVMAEARSARARQESLAALLAKGSKEYAPDALKPFINVLREAGLVT